MREVKFDFGHWIAPEQQAQILNQATDEPRSNPCGRIPQRKQRNYPPSALDRPLTLASARIAPGPAAH
jgi:hypothetical protein